MSGLHLVLDLDETLVYAQSLSSSVARPYLHSFLDFCFARFSSVSIWTTASREWFELNRVLHLANYPFALVYTGERCPRRWDYEFAFHRDPQYIPYKPLKKMWRRNNEMTPHNTVIVDDDPKNSIKNYGNALLISSFDGNSEDCELIKMQQRLERLLERFAATRSVRLIDLGSNLE